MEIIITSGETFQGKAKIKINLLPWSKTSFFLVQDNFHLKIRKTTERLKGRRKVPLTVFDLLKET
jgi:hypothetical protein